MDFLTLQGRQEFNFTLTMDCEGTNFDKNLEANASKLLDFLNITSENNIYTVLFVTPYFADMLRKLEVIDRINRDCKVIWGLHIHPENLPSEISGECPFISSKKVHMTDYSFNEQKKIILDSVKYINSCGIENLQGFRGGYFSINDETERILRGFTDIKWESHNTYRKEYMVTDKILTPCPVYAYDDKTEFRFEDYDEMLFDGMINRARFKDEKIIGITHSYLLDSNDVHYKRDNISLNIFDVLLRIAEKIR